MRCSSNALKPVAPSFSFRRIVHDRYDNYRSKILARMQPYSSCEAIGWGFIAHVKKPSDNNKKLDPQDLNIPPEALIFKNLGANASMDAGELERAQWLWKRQPKNLSIERVLSILIFCAGFWLAAMCLDQEAVGSMVIAGTGCSLVIAIPVYTYINALRFARWNSD
jgi:hypothetical protein